MSAAHSQSLADFRQKAAETLERLNKTGEPEILTVDGEIRAVLLSPAAYDELAREAHLSKDVAIMRRAIREIDEGKGREADEFFGEIRARLLAIRDGGAPRTSE